MSLYSFFLRIMSDKVGAGDILVCVCALKRNMPPKIKFYGSKNKTQQQQQQKTQRNWGNKSIRVEIESKKKNENWNKYLSKVYLGLLKEERGRVELSRNFCRCDFIWYFQRCPKGETIQKRLSLNDLWCLSGWWNPSYVNQDDRRRPIPPNCGQQIPTWGVLLHAGLHS